jgi:hypothetical protein
MDLPRSLRLFHLELLMKTGVSEKPDALVFRIKMGGA